MIGSLNSINSIYMNSITNKKEDMNVTSSNLFESALNSAKELIIETNSAEKVVEMKTVDFLTGKNDNIHDLMISQEKASILLQFTMQVRNNALDAYREIMRLPV